MGGNYLGPQTPRTLSFHNMFQRASALFDKGIFEMVTEETDEAIDLRETVVVKPSRRSRVAVLLVSAAVTPLVNGMAAAWLSQQFFSSSLISSICGAIGALTVIPIIGFNYERRFLVRNTTTGMFVTQDTLRSLLGKKDINVSYGPGTHFSFPWERRLAGNNILLEDAPININFTLQHSDGTLYGEGSYRMRPDPDNPVTFLSSAAAVGEEVRDLIIAEIQAFFKGKTAFEAFGMMGELNVHLTRIFVTLKAIVEKNNGIKISDVTVSKLVPSAELQRTIAGISEARAVQEGILVLLGLDNEDALKRALEIGTITREQVDKARRDFLSISGNTEGLTINRHELSVEGVTGDMLQALAAIANTPAARGFAGAYASRNPNDNRKRKGKPRT